MIRCFRAQRVALDLAICAKVVRRSICRSLPSSRRCGVQRSAVLVDRMRIFNECSAHDWRSLLSPSHSYQTLLHNRNSKQGSANPRSRRAAKTSGQGKAEASVFCPMIKPTPCCPLRMRQVVMVFTRANPRRRFFRAAGRDVYSRPDICRTGWPR